MKKVLKFFFRLIIIVVLLAGILFIASKLLEQKIVDKAITILNNQLDVPIYVDNISFSLLKKFPNATLQMNNVTILSAKDFNRSHFEETSADTLVFIKELYLSMNLPALLNNSLHITKAYMQNGQINILVDRNGKVNYEILDKNKKKTEPKDSENNFQFLLNQIQFKQVNINFINKYKNTSVSISAPLYTLNGQFYKKEYTANSKGKLLLNYFKQGDVKIQPELPANIDMDLNINNNQLEIIQSSIETKDYQFSTNGRIILGIPVKLDLKVTGNSNSIDKLIGMFYTNNTGAHLSDGQLGISAIIKGESGSIETPTIVANFKLINGSISNENNITLIDTIEFEGSYSNGKDHRFNTSSIEINNALLIKGASKVTGTVSVNNFETPNIKIYGNTSLSLADINSFNFNNTNYIFDGKIDGNFNCQCVLKKESSSTMKHIINWNKTGNFIISNGKFIAEEQNLSITDINGELAIQDNRLSFNNFISTIQNSVVNGNLFMDDFLLPIIDSTIALKIGGNIKADIIHYKDFKHFFNANNSNKTNREIIINGNIKADRVFYNKLVADSISSHIYYVNNQLRITNLQFNTMGGVVFSDINYISKSKQKQIFQTYTSSKNVNIKTLFSTFDSFNQTFIKDENIDGNLTTSFDLEMIFINGKLKPSSIEFLGHSLIENGKLINFKLIEEASKFSEIKEMKNIEFSSLESNILISSGIVNIPKTEIISNAFDISLFGYHKFSGDYEYHMRIHLSDFIGGKSKRLAKQQSEFGYIEDDGYGKTTLFLLATSKNGKSKMKLDGNEIKKNLKSNARDEKRELKKALHDQFGWFKQDTTLKNSTEPKKQEFIIEWDEE